MHFFKSLIVGASALAALVAAQSDLKFTKAPQNAQAGQSYPITWSGGDQNSPVTILLREGQSTDLKTVSTITSSATGGSYTWKVPNDIPVGSSYALEIQQGESAPNYWTIGNIAGGSASASASASASVSSAASSASSAASSAVSSASSKVSSAVSALSSKLSSVTASSTSAHVTGSSSSRNSTTVSRASLSSTRSGSHTASSSGSSSTEGSSSSSAGAAAPSQSAPGAAAGLKSNAALVLGAVAAMAYLG